LSNEKLLPPVKKCMGNIGVSHRESIYPAENGDPARRFAYVACGRCDILYVLKLSDCTEAEFLDEI
jgi:hypothetical protein